MQSSRPRSNEAAGILPEYDSSSNTPPSRTVRRPSCGWGQPAKGWPRSVPPLLGARLLPTPSYPVGRSLLLISTPLSGARQRHRCRVRRLRAQTSAVAASFVGVRMSRLPRPRLWLPLSSPILLELPMLERSATPRRLEMRTGPLLAH